MPTSERLCVWCIPSLLTSLTNRRLCSTDNTRRDDALLSRDVLRLRGELRSLEFEVLLHVESDESIVLAKSLEADSGDLIVKNEFVVRHSPSITYCGVLVRDDDELGEGWHS